MASLPPIGNSSIQMSTPIDALPLKTTTDQNAAIDDDPVIMSVLKDFEQHKQTESPETPQIPTQIPTYKENPQPQPVPVNTDTMNYNQSKASILDKNIIKKSVIIAVAMALVYNTSILEQVLKKLPESIMKYVSGREMYVYFVISFVIIYILQYYSVV